MTLLAWLASAQRVLDPWTATVADPAFRAAIMRCAGLLDGMGLRLSPITLGRALRAGRAYGSATVSGTTGTIASISGCTVGQALRQRCRS